ncbi:hypothetical protein DFO47_11239 [Arthrobacter sp. AG258]|nr:hypothetical protein DFO47_11239 [Arthrobacter sp. AG258]
MKKETAAAFWIRAAAFFAAYGITVKALLTDNGSCCCSRALGLPPLRQPWDRTSSASDPPLPASNQRQGRTLQSHPRHRMGLRPALHLRNRTRRNLQRLAPPLQSSPKPHRHRRQIHHQPRSQPRTHVNSSAAIRVWKRKHPCGKQWYFLGYARYSRRLYAYAWFHAGSTGVCPMSFHSAGRRSRPKSATVEPHAPVPDGTLQRHSLPQLYGIAIIRLLKTGSRSGCENSRLLALRRWKD